MKNSRIQEELKNNSIIKNIYFLNYDKNLIFFKNSNHICKLIKFAKQRIRTISFRFYYLDY